MVHISTILHPGPTPYEDHLCPECAQNIHAVVPLLDPRAEPLPVVSAQPVMSLSGEARARLRAVHDKLAELDPILHSFCAHRGYDFRASSEVWLRPFRCAWARGEIDRYLDLTTDATFLDILKRGFYPKMPWSLCASATPPRAPNQPFRILTVDIFRALPFSDLASVLEQRLEEGFAFLRDLTLQEILSRGVIPQGRPRPSRGRPW